MKAPFGCHSGATVVAVAMMTAVGAPAIAGQAAAAQDLVGPTWQLVEFVGGDDARRVPDDRSKYTLAFDADGGIVARIDCNRGRGRWESSGPSQLRFGPMALTRALCPPTSLHDQIVKHWDYVRSYVIKDGRLHLSLMADGGIYTFAPATEAPKSPVAAIGPVTFSCKAGDADAGELTATFYRTEPGLALLVRDSVTVPAFQVVAASGAKYEGNGVRFWEARGEATVLWHESTLSCVAEPVPDER